MEGFDQSRLRDPDVLLNGGTYNICRGCHGIQMTFLKIDSEGNDGTDERTKLEEGPEDAERLAFILLEWVTHHNTSLGRPEQSGGDTKDCAGENQEPACTLGLVTGGKEGLAAEMSCCLISHIRPESTDVECITQGALDSGI